MEWKQREPVVPYNDSDDIREKVGKLRGIEDIDSFLNPDRSALHSPYLLDNIEYVANRIVLAVKRGEKVAISADIDADGITSMAILYNYLKPQTDNVYVIYHQRSQGHGIENQLDMLQEDTDLLVILDSSTSSSDTCKNLQEQGIEILIVDHHQAENENPYATIVNPQLDNYPNKDISGAGLTYKLIQVLDDTLQSQNPDYFLDLCAIGMYADQMSVAYPENRYMIIKGMKNIRNKGVKAILKKKKIDYKKVNSQSIGFGIAPLINGVARMDRIELAIDIFITENEKVCIELVKAMLDINEERKKKEQDLMEHYEELINEDDKIIVVAGDMPSASFNGLVAQKLAQKYKRPAIVMRNKDGSMAGSFRSFANFKMKEFLSQLDGVVNFALGHEYAGGTGMSEDNYDKFREIANEHLKDVAFEKDIVYDLEIKAEDVSLDLFKEIEEINFLSGNGFPKLKFKVSGLRVAERRVIGRNKDTIKISCDALEIIKFKESESYAYDLGAFDTIDIVGELNINEFFNWKYRKLIVTPQAFLEDYILS